jgi:hypothetical protein
MGVLRKLGGDDRIRTGDKGFADPRLNHLATSPLLERETGFEPATFSLARRCSTPEPLPRFARAGRSRPASMLYPSTLQSVKHRAAANRLAPRPAHADSGSNGGYALGLQTACRLCAGS